MSLYDYYYTSGGTATTTAGSNPAAGTATYEDGVLGLSPVGYWPMDDASGNLADATGSGWTATVNGNPLYQQTGPTIDGVAQDAVAFDGTGDYATVAATIDDSVTTQMTVSVWFMVPPTASAQAICGMSNTGDISWRVLLGSGGDPGFYTYQTDGATIHGYATGPAGYDDGAWHHLVGWIDASGYVNVNVDGGAATGQDTTLVGTWNGPTTSTLNIGAVTSAGASPMTGSLAHLAYWDSDIGSSDRASLYTGSF